MGFFSKLFGTKPAPPSPSPNIPAHIAEALAHAPRLVNEGPEFPLGPIVLARTVTPAQIDAALAQAGFAQIDQSWTRGEITVAHRIENGVTLIEFTGTNLRDAQRELLAALPWIDTRRDFYEAMRDPRTPIADLRYLICALRHYKCVGGVPVELRRHADPEIQETVRLIDRDQMAAAARAQRSKKR